MSVHLLTKNTISDKTAYKMCTPWWKWKRNKNGNKNAERQNGNWTKMRHKQQLQFCNEQTVGPNKYSIWSHHCEKKCHIFFAVNDSRPTWMFPLSAILSFSVSVSSTRNIAITINVITYAKKPFKNVFFFLFSLCIGFGTVKLQLRHFCLIFWPQWKNNNSSTLNPQEQALSAISYTWTMRHEMRKKPKRINRHKSILCSEFDSPIVFLRLFVLNLKLIHLVLKKVEKNIQLKK